ncbi:hypothetical protein ACEPPN_012327 [Leptodophora sp. 'Broadleaf-Isolate-01']
MAYDPNQCDVKRTCQHDPKSSSLASSKADLPWKLTATLTTASNAAEEDVVMDGKAEGRPQGETEGEDTGCSETTRASQDTSTADQDTHDMKRRKISEYPHLATLLDIGGLIAAGGTGLVYQYQQNLVLKIYRDAKTFHNELRAYLQISASPLFNKTPRFAEKVLLPECFLNRRFIIHQRHEFKPYSFGLILQQLNGISHADVKSNNFMLHTREWKEPCSTVKTNNFEEDCFIIDFGEAVFQSDCSRERWKDQCQVDLIDASLMFAVPRAQLAIASLTQWLQTHCVSQSSDEHNSGDLDSLTLVFPKTDTTQLTFEQEQFLTSTLCAAAALPVKAIPLVNTLVKRISSPSLPLIEIIVKIFCGANMSKAAIKYIDKQLTPSCISRRTMQNQNAITVSLYQLKIRILHRGNYKLAYRIKTLQAAVSFSEKHFQDVIDIQTFEWRRELSLTLYDQGEMDQARSLYDMSLQVLNQERNDRGDKRTDSGDDMDRKDIRDTEDDTDTEGSGEARADAREDAREDTREDAKWILRNWAQTLDERDRVAEMDTTELGTNPR